MKCAAVLLASMLILLPCWALGEGLGAAIDQVIDTLDAASLESLLSEDDPFTSTGGFRETLRSLARGEITLSFDEVMRLLMNRFAASWSGSLWRITRLMAPALVWAILGRLPGKASDGGQVVCGLMVCVFLTQDISDHTKLCTDTVKRISEGMQGLFPMLLTLMAAVGGASGSALMQPAVVAASSGVTAILEHATLPLTACAAVMTMLCHLGKGIRLDRLAKLAKDAASWTLGICFTVFIGVLVTRGVSAAAVDGITIRTAKYALDNFVPFVGGLFADTVDALVGSGLLVQSALGVTGLMMTLSWSLGPLCQTLAAAVLYKLAAALMQPVSGGGLGDCIHDFSELLMLLFVIELSAGAMFLMLIAQMIAVSGMIVMLR